MKQLILLSVDYLLFFVALYLALGIRNWGDFSQSGTLLLEHLRPYGLIGALLIVSLYIAGFYDHRMQKMDVSFYSVLLKILFLNGAIAIALFYTVQTLQITPKTVLLLTFGAFFFLFSLWRFLFQRFLKNPLMRNNVVIIGNVKEQKETIEAFHDLTLSGYSLTNVMNDHNAVAITNLLREKNINTVITAFDPYSRESLVEDLYRLLPLQLTFVELPVFYERMLNKIPVSVIGQFWFLQNLHEHEKQVYDTIKRIIDITLSFFMFPFFLALLPIIAFAIKINSKGHIFYTQIRTGKNDRLFSMIKFRTMCDNAESHGAQWAQKQDPRVTKVGKWLRVSRLDELPQIINMLVGDMSFIGPRPERPEFIKDLQKKIPYYSVRHIIKPGLTGWAQIKYPYGSSTADAMEKLQYDLYYIKNRSLLLDVSILLKTINTILTRAGR